jgi:protein-disulfide isomerase
VTSKTTKTQQRLLRQEKARAVREAERRATARRKRFVVGAIVAAVIVLMAGIGIAVGVSRSGKSGPLVAPRDAVTTGSPVAQGGMLIGKATAPVTLDLYEDFTCPICGEFEKGDGATVSKLIADGRVKVRYHMLSFIDDNNGSTYSHRAANAFAAADTFAGADKALALHAALYANQPSETSSTGLPNTRILDLASTAGITSQPFTDAVDKNAYASWVSRAADDGSKAGVNGTPTIYVNEKKVDLTKLVNASKQFDPALLTAAVDTAAK